MKERIIENIKETILTGEEWHESMNVGIFPRPSYVNRPHTNCPVVFDEKRNEYRVYSLISEIK